MRTVLMVLAVSLALTGCGKKGPPQPAGPADQVIWPKAYPKPDAGT